MQEKPPPSGGT